MRLSSRRGKSSADEARSAAAASVGDTPIVRFRRFSPVGMRPGEGLLNEPTAVIQPWLSAGPELPEAVEKRVVGGERRAVFFGHDG